MCCSALSVRALLRLALLLVMQVCGAVAAFGSQYNVLFVSAYNPAASSTASVVADFSAAMRERGVMCETSIESLGCDNFFGIEKWHERMRAILEPLKTRGNEYDAIVLLGQEAQATYLSLEISQVPDVPVFCAMVSQNYVEIPSEPCDVTKWEPEVRDINDVAGIYNIVGGYFYRYDFHRNVEIVRRYFPDVTRLAVLTDNSYGGVLMRTYCKEMSVRCADFDYRWLDGRELSMVSVIDSLAELPDSSALLLGTWRYDKDHRYCINTTISLFRQVDAHLPVVTLSSTGLEDLAIGGFVPNYIKTGALLAGEFLNFKQTGKAKFNFVEDKYVFNYESMMNYGVTEKDLPEGAEVIGKPKTFFQTYANQVLAVLIFMVVLIIVLVATFIYLSQIRSLNSRLMQKESELIVARDRAENNSKLKTAFMADMSHEIRTPLNAIVGFSQVLTSQATELSEDERRSISDIVSKNSNLLLGILNSCLDISRIESGKVKFSIERIDLVEVCRTALASVQIAQDRDNLSFEFETALDECGFDTDRQRLEQVLLNLLGNSVKFTPSGTITLRLERDGMGSAVVISVTDTGRGIDIDKAEDIFLRFVKLDEYATGTGLGLPLCRMIVERLGGRIWVDTSYTAGARFVVSLPVLNERMIDILRGGIS